MGWFVRHQGNLQEALAQYQELEKEDPRDFRPYLCQVQALSAIFFSTMEAVYVNILMRHVALHGILTHLHLSNCLMNSGVLSFLLAVIKHFCTLINILGRSKVSGFMHDACMRCNLWL
jgi:hypothetical protein